MNFGQWSILMTSVDEGNFPFWSRDLGLFTQLSLSKQRESFPDP